MVVFDRCWLKVGKGYSGYCRDFFVVVVVVVGCCMGIVCFWWGMGCKGDSFLVGVGVVLGLGCICSCMGSVMVGLSCMGCSGLWVLDVGEIIYLKRCLEIYEIREVI